MKLLNTTGRFLLASLVFILSSDVFAEYKTKSAFSDDYKCVSEKKGGFNHNKDGSKLTSFRGQEEFFLTHISNIPREAFTSGDINDLRQNYENQFFEISETYGTIEEKGSYSIRRPDQDPKLLPTHFLNRCNVNSIPTPNDTGTINCYTTKDLMQFSLDLETMRFTYSYLGTWHLKQFIKDYYGDSSVFAFGTCKKYFR